MMFTNENATLGEAPIECGYDNPNCLGGWSGILSATDVRELPIRSNFGIVNPPPFIPPAFGNGPTANSSAAQAPASIPPNRTLDDGEADETTIDGNTLLLAGAAILGIILLSK